MYTLQHYISEIRKALPLDFQRIDDRLIIRLLNEFRAIYIKNESNKNVELPRQLIQILPGIEMNAVDQSDTFFISTESRILKSVTAIPVPVKNSHRDLVINIRNAKILSESYNYVTKDNAVYSGNGRYNKNDIFVFYHDNYAYIKLNKYNPKIRFLTHITIEQICENPLDCIPYQYAGYYDQLEYEYPLTDVVWGYIKSNILKDGLGIIQSEINEQNIK